MSTVILSKSTFKLMLVKHEQAHGQATLISTGWLHVHTGMRSTLMGMYIQICRYTNYTHIYMYAQTHIHAALFLYLSILLPNFSVFIHVRGVLGSVSGLQARGRRCIGSYPTKAKS